MDDKTRLEQAQALAVKRAVPKDAAKPPPASVALQKAKKSSVERKPYVPPPIDPAAGLPKRFMAYGLDDFSGCQEAVRRYLASDTDTLYLWGETGTHKTTLALAVLRELRARHQKHGGIFLPAYTAATTLRQVSDPNFPRAIKKWREEQWLVLDDLGKHRDTPHVIEQLLFLIHYRYDWAESPRRTIITANMDLDNLARRIDPATARRLEEGAVLHMTNESGRR